MTESGISDPGVPAGVEEQVGGSNAGRPGNAGLKVLGATRPEDILAVRDTTLAYDGKSRYAHIPLSERKFIRVFSKAISRPHNTLALYVQHNGKTVGMLNAGAGTRIRFRLA